MDFFDFAQVFFLSKILQSDAYQATGCYNLLCSGFIQINSEIAMGASISPVSGYRNSQFDISILVWKVKSQGLDIQLYRLKMLEAKSLVRFSVRA